MDQIKEVRKCIVRISFKWMVKLEKAKDGEADTATEPMVHSGIIASINADGCKIITTSVFFKAAQFPKEFSVHLPTEEGYGPETRLLTVGLDIGPNFTSFGLWSRDISFLKPVTFDTRVLEACDEVFIFIFPREGYITPTGYARGRIVWANPNPTSQLGISFQDSQFHEYGRFGAPVFNDYGNLVGICCNSQIRTHFWTVDYIKRKVLDSLECSICYVGS